MNGVLDTEKNRQKYLFQLKNALIEDLNRLRMIISRPDRSGGSYTSDKVVELYHIPTDNGGFISFARKLIIQLKQIDKRGTSKTTLQP